MYKFKKDKAFSNNGRNVIEAKVGEEHELNDYLAKAFLAQGIVEKVTKETQKEEKENNNSSDEKVTEEIPERIKGFLDIFEVEPKKLDVKELKELADFYGISYRKNIKENALIEKISNLKA